MRVETIHGRHLLCGCILPRRSLKHGQVWASADGSNRTVTISGVRDDWVGYTWKENGQPKYHEKTVFAFQCRYCLVLPTTDIPADLKEP